MTDLPTRADRIQQIAELLHGRVLARDGDAMWIEIPADVIGGALTPFGMGGFPAAIGKQSTRLAPRRIVNMVGHTVVCDEKVTTAFYGFKVSLQPHAVAVATDPHAATIAITATTKPHTA
jgi:hypothetical protein